MLREEGWRISLFIAVETSLLFFLTCFVDVLDRRAQ